MIENSFRYVGGGLAPVLPQLSARLRFRSISLSCSFVQLLEVARPHGPQSASKDAGVGAATCKQNAESEANLKNAVLWKKFSSVSRAIETRTIRFIKRCPRLSPLLGGFFRALAMQKGARSPQDPARDPLGATTQPELLPWMFQKNPLGLYYFRFSFC